MLLTSPDRAWVKCQALVDQLWPGAGAPPSGPMQTNRVGDKGVAGWEDDWGSQEVAGCGEGLATVPLLGPEKACWLSNARFDRGQKGPPVPRGERQR